jgi:adhesin transport system membrane fusion protein
MIENETDSKTILLEKKVKGMNAFEEIVNENMAYCVVDENLIVQDVSKAFNDIYGYSIESLKNKLFSFIVAKQSTTKFYNGCEYVKNNENESWGTILDLEAIDGKDIYSKVMINPTFHENKFSGFILVMQDVTSQRLLQKLQVKIFSDEKVDKTTLQFVSSTSAAVLDTISYKVSAVVKIVVSFILLFIVYATLFDIDEITKGQGSFIPTSKVQHLKNYEGGVVSNIYVREGDTVKKGQILLKFNPISHKSKLDENTIRLLELEGKVARLKAESLGIEMEKIDCTDGCDEKLLNREKQYYISNMQELNKNLSKQEEQLKSKQSSLEDAENIYKILVVNYKILSSEFLAKKKLEKKKIFTKYELGLLERELNDARSAKKSAEENIVQIKTQIQEIKDGMEETTLTFRNKASLQYNETSAELSRLKETQKNLEDIIKRTIIRSPVNGVVKEIFVHTLGSSIQASAELLTIVPDNYEMVAEVKIKPAEIAKLHIGQSVNLKVTAFDYSIYGDLKGKITYISPDTITDKDSGEDFYIIHVKTKVNYLNNNEKYKIKIGMMVNANVLVGKKSIMSYLLKPILKSTQKD